MKKKLTVLTKKRVKIISLVISTLVSLLFILTIIYYSRLDNVVETGVSKYGIIVLFLASIFLESFPQFLSPQAMLVGVVASGFDIYSAIISVAIGSVIGSILGFYIGKKHMFQLVDYMITKKKKEKMLGYVNSYGACFLFLAALTPLPYFPIFFGALSMKWKRFIFFGIIPRIVSFIIFGYFGYLF